MEIIFTSKSQCFYLLNLVAFHLPGCDHSIRGSLNRQSWKKTSFIGLVIGCLLAGISFYLKVHEIALKSVPVLALSGILVYIGSFSTGMGAGPRVVMSEISPINIKGIAGSLATLVNWFGAWLCSYKFNYLMTWSSPGKQL